MLTVCLPNGIRNGESNKTASVSSLPMGLCVSAFLIFKAKAPG